MELGIGGLGIWKTTLPALIPNYKFQITSGLIATLSDQ
jgi:hypothetical protein